MSIKFIRQSCSRGSATMMPSHMPAHHPKKNCESAESAVEPVQARRQPHQLGAAAQARLDVDMQRRPERPTAEGELKIIAAILVRPVIEKILTHLALDPQPPPKVGRARARAPALKPWVSTPSEPGPQD